METMISDEALMLRYRDGDFAAFKTLYAKHSQPLYRFIAWQSPRLDWTEEVIQDTWMRLHGARESYLPQSSFKTYLYQIAKNRLTDLLRQRQELLASDMRQDEEVESTFEHLANQNQDNQSPEQSLAQRQQNEILHAAIKQLPAEQRGALISQQFSQMSLEEIAEVTGVSIETVKSRLRYAMRKLREQLSGMREGAEED
jgi:RNA polymerase sigma-70 factor (ECF subfamily)